MTTAPEAGFFRRFFALIYDALVVTAILIFASAIGLGVAALIYGTEAIEQGGVLVENPFLFAWLIFCWFYYYFYCWSKVGQTIAMKAWRLKLVTNSGDELQLWQALVRFFSGLFGISIITTILPQKWALHDWLSQTRVIVLPKETKV